MFLIMYSPFKKILLFFLIWRVTLFLAAFAAMYLIPNFGGSFPYADKILVPTGLPEWIWGFGNFDGVHYIKIAQEGYRAEYSQAFFPLFPLLVGILGYFISSVVEFNLAYFLSGIVLSNLFFVLALYFTYKLFSIDFDQKTSLKAIILIILFPTSFYFISIYTESLFLLLAALSFLFIRNKNYLISGLFICLASATRVIGFLLIIPLLLEVYNSIKSQELFKKPFELIKAFFGLMISPLGLLIYMFYLNSNFGNPFYFITSQPAFGTERSVNNIVILPQVFFRYIKIFLSTPLNSGAFFIACLEFSFSLIVLIFLIIFFKKMRLSYWFFSSLNFILPTLTGTLLSMPRFVLMSFLILPLLISKIGENYFKIAITFIIMQIALFVFFIRGYWIA